MGGLEKQLTTFTAYNEMRLSSKIFPTEMNLRQKQPYYRYQSPLLPLERDSPEKECSNNLAVILNSSQIITEFFATKNERRCSKVGGKAGRPMLRYNQKTC